VHFLQKIQIVKVDTVSQVTTPDLIHNLLLIATLYTLAFGLPVLTFLVVQGREILAVEGLILEKPVTSLNTTQILTELVFAALASPIWRAGRHNTQRTQPPPWVMGVLETHLDYKNFYHILHLS
jgi:hypothetical protein